MSKGVKIAIAVILIVVVIGAVIMIAAGHEVVRDHGELNAKVELTDTIPVDLPGNKPAEGYTYCWATVTIKNNDYKSGFSNNYFYLKCKVDGKTYTCDTWNTSSMKTSTAYTLVTLDEGASGTWDYIFQIPEGSDPAGVEILYDGPVNLTCKTAVKA